MEVAAAEIPGIDLPRGLVPLREGVSVSTREEQAVRRFILRANLAETLWGWYLDTSYVQHFYGSDYLADYEELIETYHADDVKRAALFDYQGSYFVDIRAVGSAAYEADACEVWDVHAYRLSDESYLGQYEGYPRLIPQTLRLEQSGGRWVVSHSEFFEPPHFCE